MLYKNRTSVLPHSLKNIEKVFLDAKLMNSGEINKSSIANVEDIYEQKKKINPRRRLNDISLNKTY